MNHESSEQYWIKRYAKGQGSGAGSHGKLATFKAEVVNRFVRERQIQSVIEFGCGDGHQLRLMRFPHYTGFDVSPVALLKCTTLFENDATKRFKPIDQCNGETAELALSLDVIYHLVEDDVFEDHMAKLASAAEEYIIIYSSNTDVETKESHVKHRRFTDDSNAVTKDFRLIKYIPNRYPYPQNTTGSFADFYIYRREARHDCQ